VPFSSESDFLTGNGGADQFVLGDAQNYFYLGSGKSIITDFKRSDGDKVQLKGNASLYTESDVNWGVGTSALDTAIYKNGDLIAVLQDVSGSSFILNQDVVFV
jgi:Ca2+-binding RTX toxin-like protein